MKKEEKIKQEIKFLDELLDVERFKLEEEKIISQNLLIMVVVILVPFLILIITIQGLLLIYLFLVGLIVAFFIEQRQNKKTMKRIEKRCDSIIKVIANKYKELGINLELLEKKISKDF